MSIQKSPKEPAVIEPDTDQGSVNPGNNFGTSGALTPGTNFGTNQTVSPGSQRATPEIDKDIARLKKEQS